MRISEPHSLQNIIAQVTTLFHVYNKWKMLEDNFNKYNLISLSKFLYQLNQDYYNIVTKYKNINDMKEPFFNLAEKYDKIEYNSLLDI